MKILQGKYNEPFVWLTMVTRCFHFERGAEIQDGFQKHPFKKNNIIIIINEPSSFVSGADVLIDIFCLHKADGKIKQMKSFSRVHFQLYFPKSLYDRILTTLMTLYYARSDKLI